MRAFIVLQKVQRALDMAENGILASIEERDLFFKELKIPGFLEICSQGEHHPQRAVGIWFFIDWVPAPQCQSVGILVLEGLQQYFLCPIWIQ